MRNNETAKDSVAIILAAGLAIALTLIVAAIMYDAVRSDTPGLSENATQILTGWGGGILGVLGSFIGYRAGEKREQDVQDRAERIEERHNDNQPGQPVQQQRAANDSE